MKPRFFLFWFGIAGAAAMAYCLSVGPVLQFSQKRKFGKFTVSILRGFYAPIFGMARSYRFAFNLYEDYQGFWGNLFHQPFEKQHPIVTESPQVSPDGEYEVRITKHGGAHADFSTRNRKHVELYLAKRKVWACNRRDHDFVAGNLQSMVVWSNQHLNITFFDDGAGLESSRVAGGVVGSNHIASLHFIQVAKLPLFTIAELEKAGPTGFREEK